MTTVNSSNSIPGPGLLEGDGLLDGAGLLEGNGLLNSAALSDGGSFLLGAAGLLEKPLEDDGGAAGVIVLALGVGYRCG